MLTGELANAGTFVVPTVVWGLTTHWPRYYKFFYIIVIYSPPSAEDPEPLQGSPPRCTTALLSVLLSCASCGLATQ